jgi:PAS domain S-box-containing protein
MKARIGTFLDQILNGEARSPVKNRQRQLLSIFILAFLVFTVIITFANLVELLLTKSTDKQNFLVGGVIGIALLAGLWVLNRKGYTHGSGAIFMLLFVLTCLVVYPQDQLDRNLLLFAIPTVGASFVIGPAYSFAFAALSILGYTIQFAIGEASSGYNLLFTPALFLTAFVAWLGASRLEFVQTQVRQVETRFQALVEQIAAVVYIDAPDGTSSNLYTSPQIEKLLGYTSEEWLSDKELWSKLLHPDDRERALAENIRTNQTGDPFKMEYRMIARDGRVVWVYDEALLERDALGHPKRWHGVMYDITERKTAEYRKTKLYDCFLSYGANPIENINRLTALCGELLGGTCALYNRLDQGMLCSWGQWKTPADYNPSDRPEGHLCYTVIQQAEDKLMVVRNLLETAYAQTDPNVIPNQLQTYIGKSVKLGESNIGSLCVVYQKDYIPTQEDERTMGFIASAIAVEEKRYQAEEALRDSQARYRQAVENSPIPIFSVDRAGMILTWNRACQDLFQYGADILGHSYDELIHDKDNQPFYNELLSHVFKLKRSLDEVNISFRCKDGSIRHTLSRLYPLLDRTGVGVECVFANTDITERIQAEKIQTATYNISEAAHSTSNLGELYHSIHGILGELMPAENFYIALYDVTNDMLSFPYFVDAYDETPAPSKPGRGLTEYVLRKEQPLLASPEVFDKLFEQGEVDSIGTPSIDWLGVPLKIEERTIGVMVVQSYSGGVRYGENEADILKFVSTQVAMAIERKRTEEALEQRASELALLYQTSLEINALPDLPTLLYAIVERAARLLGAPMGGLYMMNPDGKSLQLVVSYNLPGDHTGTILQLGEGLSGRAAESGETEMVADYMNWEGRATAYEGITFRRVLGVPLKVGENVIGVINVTDDEQTGLFSEDEVRLVSLFADQAAIAVENARLYESAQHELADRKRTEVALHASETRYRSLFEDSPISLWEADLAAVKTCIEEARQQGITDIELYIEEHPELVAKCVGHVNIKDVNKTSLKMFQADSKKVLMSSLASIFNVESYDLFREELIAISRGETDFEGEGILCTVAGNPVDIRIHWSAAPGYETTLSNVIVSIIDITARKQRERELEVVASVSTALRAAQNHAEMLPVLLDQVIVLLKAKASSLTLTDAATGDAVVELARGDWSNATGQRIPAGTELNGKIFSTVEDPSKGGSKQPDFIADEPLIAHGQAIGTLWVGRDTPITASEMRLLTAVADIAANAIHRSTLYEQTQLHAEQMAAVSATGRALAETLNLPEIYSRLTHAVYSLLPDISAILLSIYKPQQELMTWVYGMSDGEVVDISKLPPHPIGAANYDPQSEAIYSRNSLVIHDTKIQSKYTVTHFAIGSSPPESALFVPLLGKGGVLGLLQLQSCRFHRFSQGDIELLTLLGNTASIAIENARLFAETEQRLRRLAALRAMDMAISSSFDLRVTLNVLLDQVTALLEVDAAAVLLFNKYAQTLEYSAGRGFRGSAITHTRLRLGEDLPGRAAFERQLISVRESSQSTISHPRVAGEDFSTYFGVPLIVKGELKGVLEIFHRAPLSPDLEWLDFLETLAGDTAIAIDNTALFYDLQRTNMELTLAYDSTLEGWSRVLEIRRQEPEGHTQRVVELTLDLAENMGISETELVNIRRGALLHDIGALGIPDSILYKPEPLLEEEWSILRRHPIYAYQILSPIAYLRPSLEIPYCHHEKWDGTGYPRGLKGNQIPLAARIFAIVDVWDSLRSDRPYRTAWTDQETLEHIRLQAGLHFDPQVVEAFIKIVGKKEARKIAER